MKKRLILLAGLGVGYVLGSRTGRQSYEKLKAQVQDLWSDPRVQETFDKANQTIRDRAPGVADAVKSATDKVTHAAGAASVAAGADDPAADGSAADETAEEVAVSEIDGDEDALPEPRFDKNPDVFGDPAHNLDDEGPAGVADDD